MRTLLSRIHTQGWWCFWLVCIVTAANVGGTPALTIRAEQVQVNRFDVAGLLSIYIRNTTDTVVGYQFWLKLDRPDIALFEEAFDTAGTLSSGWDLVHVRSISGSGVDAMVVGLANDITREGAGAPIAPSDAERLLVRIPFRVQAIPDSMTDRTAKVIFDPWPSYLSFSRPNGTSIGLVPAIIADTACYRCNAWFDTICLAWERVALPPCDSTFITLDTISVLDTLQLVTVPGSISICNRTVLDVDVNHDGMTMTVSDLVALIRFIVRDTDSIGDSISADVNGDCVINWGDALLLDSLYSLSYNPPPERWPQLPCPCEHPARGSCCWQKRGNLNGDMKQMVDLSDLSILVAYLSGSSAIVFTCPDEANIDGAGIVDLSDLSRLVAFLVGGGSPPAQCP